MCGYDVRVREGTCQGEQAGKDAAEFPGDDYAARLAALGPEEVEEEGAAEDGGDVDADEDVVGCDADEVVVVDGCEGVLMGDEILLGDVV